MRIMSALKSGRLAHFVGCYLLAMLTRCTREWHDLDNTEYDCWPLEKPHEYNMIDCGGLEMAWVQRPSEKVLSGEEFNVTYAVTVTDHFYRWAVENSILSHTNPTEAKAFCEEKECPSDWKNANEDNCCVHHANIHSCPLAFMVKGGICGPWIPDDGQIVTHTISTAGKISQINWTAKVVLVHLGVTSLIAHIKVGRMQAALEAKTTVLPARVCGDGNCDEGETCSTCPADCGDCTATIKIAISFPISLACVGFIITVVWFQYQKQKMLWDESWIIDFNQIKQDHTLMGSAVSVQNGASDSNTSCITTVSSCTAALNASRKQHFTQTGMFDGRTVAIKKMKKRTFSLSKAIRKEVKLVRELDHPNLCKFIGGCTEVPNVAIITEYCPKGSLNDVLLNEDIPLNWGFRFSFATDIARGMAYLHQHKMYHGKLKSTNTVIDDRWVCKLTDFCLPTYRKEDFAEPPTLYHQRLLQVYLPPEAQMMPHFDPTLTTDVYSYGIILLEIATRSDLVPKEDGNSTECGRCPPLPELISGKSENACPCPAEYVMLIRKCQAKIPTNRPTFEQVKKYLHKINPNKVSPVDMMMTLMEKYSKHLETLVAERTQDLVHEKQKTDRLLYSMLPKQVADDLRQGIMTQAQNYASATIFFSDIEGFTQLSSTSTPYQVVELLNKLYTTFDEIIDNHDVYKVETIGDAYMVVSGVPKENGIGHASEIASMALDLVAVCNTFKIPHKPQTKLKIRAGIHSALKIQCSSSTNSLLEQFGGYVLICRGTLQIKGKGDMVTYWLEGKQSSSSSTSVNTPKKTVSVLRKAQTENSPIAETEKETYSIIPGVLSNDFESNSC